MLHQSLQNCQTLKQFFEQLYTLTLFYYQCWTHRSLTRAWGQITLTTQYFLITSNNQDLTSLTILMPTTWTPFLCHHHYLSCFLHMSDLQILHPWPIAHHRNCLWPNITEKRRHQSMNLRNTSNFLLKTLMHVIQFTGGFSDELSSQIYSAWLTTYCVFLVSSQSYTGHIFNISTV